MQSRCTFVISGPSGVGKGTICEKLINEMDDLALSVSCTTRKPRRLESGAMETDGVHYHFVSDECFHKMIDDGDFYEYATVHDSCYGTSKTFVEKIKSTGKDVILEIDMQGALQVKAVDSQAILIFILPPDYQELRRRLIGRGSESDEQVKKRLTDARGQLSYAYAYDYLVVNDDLDSALEQIKDIIHSCRLKTHHNKRRLDDITKTFYQEVR